MRKYCSRESGESRHRLGFEAREGAITALVGVAIAHSPFKYHRAGVLCIKEQLQ